MKIFPPLSEQPYTWVNGQHCALKLDLAPRAKLNPSCANGAASLDLDVGLLLIPTASDFAQIIDLT